MKRTFTYEEIGRPTRGSDGRVGINRVQFSERDYDDWKSIGFDKKGVFELIQPADVPGDWVLIALIP